MLLTHPEPTVRPLDSRSFRKGRFCFLTCSNVRPMRLLAVRKISRVWLLVISPSTFPSVSLDRMRKDSNTSKLTAPMSLPIVLGITSVTTSMDCRLIIPTNSPSERKPARVSSNVACGIELRQRKSNGPVRLSRSVHKQIFVHRHSSEQILRFERLWLAWFWLTNVILDSATTETALHE